MSGLMDSWMDTIHVSLGLAIAKSDKIEHYLDILWRLFLYFHLINGYIFGSALMRYRLMKMLRN